MELKFEQVNNLYVAEFEVTSDFNLHIERKKTGYITIKQRTTPYGEYDSVDGANIARTDMVIDLTLWDLVYPKWIKVVSEAEVTMGIVTFTGEGGNGGNGGGSNDNVDYKYVRYNETFQKFFDYCAERALVTKTEMYTQKKYIITWNILQHNSDVGDFNFGWSTCHAAEIDLNKTIVWTEERGYTAKELYEQEYNNGWRDYSWDEILASLEYITKEEFESMSVE